MPANYRCVQRNRGHGPLLRVLGFVGECDFVGGVARESSQPLFSEMVI